ncbi:caspase family protein [Micromonospora soli]|nr:caspase family protein [Micromonospora sp. NBRC 110009]WKT96849.1 caspase family protein [Micromonospora sp. NBRC 110009]
MENLPDLDSSYALIIGVDKYSRLSNLPTVANNVGAINEILRHPLIWGLPPERCTVLSNPKSQNEILEELDRAASAAQPPGTLFVYYAGHGLVEPETGEFHLSVATSDPGSVDGTAANYDSVRRRVRRSPAGHRVLVLDCCYAGRALKGEMSTSNIADMLEVDQTCLIASTSANRTALAPPDEQYTLFTGALISVILDGISGAPGLLTARDIWRRVYEIQASRGVHRPEIRSGNAGDNIPLVRNVAWRKPARPMTATKDMTNADVEQLAANLPPTAVKLAAEVLRAGGQDALAGQLLANFVVKRSPEDVRLLADCFCGTSPEDAEWLVGALTAFNELRSEMELDLGDVSYDDLEDWYWDDGLSGSEKGDHLLLDRHLRRQR